MIESFSPYCVYTFFQNAIRFSSPSLGNSADWAKAGAASTSKAKSKRGKLNLIRSTLLESGVQKPNGILPYGHFSQYGLSGDQQRVPEVSKWRRIGQIELSQIIHPKAGRDRSGGHVDPPGCIAIAHNLRSDELAAVSLDDELDPELTCLR